MTCKDYTEHVFEGSSVGRECLFCGLYELQPHPINSQENCNDESHIHPYKTNTEAKHGELLAKIEIRIADFCEDEADFCDVCSPWKALRAIVQSHRPTPHGRYGDAPICIGCSFTETGVFAIYPCLSVRAIEKEIR